ncbi:T9SS type B sorting domain-containing protein [Tenacibaculum ovolyticum]|uniref:T9SS type B sorting domain-containing protein n=1 Tax=Tenacibaculum ovolyticum TaxID=104270 RepID=UPI0022F3DA62|nr:T9SS type B sorting domain-containing protein [Tenacibaculum ovolyticum]WBX76673.1 T9SS type B sorting domain-containing protein [Tenacibaculum ovolyticum]
MKRILFTLFLIINLSSFSQNTYVPDDDFEKYLINHGYDSGALDDYVPTNNIKNIETLFLNNLGIKNFEGLQDFIALKNLKIIAGSNVKNIYISNNTNLVDLQIYGAPLLQNFDTSKNTKLEIFTIVNNSITKVNLSKNINIKEITIGNTKIKNIDLSNNSKLKNIDLNYGVFEYINLNNNNNTSIINFSCIDNSILKCVRVDDEVYSKTNWINITNPNTFSKSCGNFEELTYVPDDGFEQHLIDLGYDSGSLDDYVPTNNINTITNLSISGNANYVWEIKSLEGIEDFIALEKLTIDLNEVVTIDLYNSPKLKELYINNDALLENLDLNNNLELEIFHMINTSLQEIDLSNHLKLKDIVIGNTSIINIDLSLNTLLEKVAINHGIVKNINLKNGKNTNITYFDAQGLFDIQCIQVDKKNYSETNWTQIDDNSVFNETCYSPQLTYVPDDNFEQELINLGYDSGPLNDYVPTKNIEGIIELNVQEKNISDLTGIQDFKSLTSLTCYKNSIITINLNNLIELTNLNVSENKLTDIDISNNKKLTNLIVSENKLTDLNISNNISLEQLSCSQNKITTLDVTVNLNLILLWCAHNQLNQLNLASNKNLKRLSCGGNLYTSIDLSKNNLLQEFYAPDGNLESLNLSNNPNINYFVVSNNKLTFLDLRNGANHNIPSDSFDLRKNNLKCILVDNKNFSTNNWNFIDSISTFINTESECNKTICNISVDSLNDVSTCNSFTLPNLTNGIYYTQTNKNGIQLITGDIITSSQTIYIYNEDFLNNSCFSETSFNVTISNTPLVDILNDITAINNYMLPNLINGNYFSELNGNGIQLNSGDIITSSQIIYIYNVNSINLECYSESSFNITIEQRELIIPTFFTPNNDNKNDNWIVKANNNHIKEIYITDRFGKIVSKIKPNTIGWNGLYNGKQLPNNTYWYQIFFYDGKIKNGAFALIRN